jgi:hypothetical protein
MVLLFAFFQKSKTDLSVYRAILRGIQRDERRRGALSSLAFIIQETDIQKLIDNIWHGHSILSQCQIVTDLRLVDRKLIWKSLIN